MLTVTKTRSHTPRTVAHVSRSAGLCLAALVAGFVLAPAAYAGEDPQAEPVPIPEYIDNDRSFALTLDFSAPTQAAVVAAKVVNGATPGTEHLQRDLAVTSVSDGNALSQFTIPNPSVARGDGLSNAFHSGPRLVMIPLDTRADTITVDDISTGQRVATVDTAPVIIQLCAANPSQPECAYDLTTELLAAPDPVPAGTTLTYQAIARNASTGPALQTRLDVTLPFAANPTPPDCTAVGTQLSCIVGRIAPGGSKTVPITVPIPASAANGGAGTATIEATATAASDAWAEGDSGNNASLLATTVVAVSDLAVTKTGAPTQATANDPITYTIVVRNDGPSDADKLRIVDKLPPAAEAVYVSSELPGGACTPGGAPAETVTCELSTPLPAGGTVTMTLVVKVSDTGTATEFGNTVDATSASSDPNMANNRGQARTGVQLAPTELDVSPVLVRLEILQLEVNLGRLSAVLSRSDRDDAPIVGRTLRFTAGGQEICTAVTDETGRASCTGLSVTVIALLNLGYTVTFDGDGRYHPVTEKGHLVVIRI